MKTKYYPIMVAALAAVALLVLAVQFGCCGEGDVQLGPDITADPGVQQVLGEDTKPPVCAPPLAEGAVVAACVNGWAIADDAPVNSLPFEELARSHATLFYCDEPPHPIVGHVRLQALGWVKDGQVAVECGSADFALIFTPH